MLRYEFFCNFCGEPFSKILSADEYEEGGTLCPKCGSENVEQRSTVFYPINRKESRLIASSDFAKPAHIAVNPRLWRIMAH